MSRARQVITVLALVSVTAAAPSLASAQSADRYADLARQIVGNSAAVKPGGVVWITGGTSSISLMDALGAEVTRAGAAAELSLQTERMFSAFFRDVAEKDLRASDSASVAMYDGQLKLADVVITLPTLQDADTMIKSILSDTVRFRKLMQIQSESQRKYDAMRNNARTRFVIVNYPPSRTQIAKSGLDSASFDRMIWEAVTTDYGRINATGQRIKRLLETGKAVHVTTPDGSDFRLTLAGRPAALISNTLGPRAASAKLAAQRTIILPGGRLIVAPLETSGVGKAVSGRDECLGAPVVNERFELRAGKMTGFQADSGGECYRNFIKSAPSPSDMVGGLSIGLNPALKPVETGLGFRPWEASGAVVLFFGNNIDLGGTNNTPVGYGVWLSRATVEVDGKVIVRDGQLIADVMSSK
jgi:leucyl aminopeptidase (aminopeptidase T)